MVIRYPFAVVITVFLAGCGATNLESKLPESFSLQPGQTIEFLPIENVTGKTLDPPADQIFNQYMSGLLKERKLLNVTNEPATVILKSKLIEYEPGNAFGRWLLPGLGTTVCTVDAEILEKGTGAPRYQRDESRTCDAVARGRRSRSCGQRGNANFARASGP